MSWWLYSTRPTTGGMALIRALGGKRIRVGNNKFRPKRHRKIVNWGSTVLPKALVDFCYNHPNAVSVCVDKLAFFHSVIHTEAAQYIPPFTDIKAHAVNWCRNGKKVVARTVLRGHSGNGITITGQVDKLPDAPLYTQYIPKDEEYRIHLIREHREGDHVHQIYAQKKVKRPDFEGKHNRLVRCYDNGYMFQHNNIEVPGRVTEAAIAVFLKTGLDFGAVDVIYCRAQNRAYVLEINTAPGLEGHSVEVYAEAFKKYF